MGCSGDMYWQILGQLRESGAVLRRSKMHHHLYSPMDASGLCQTYPRVTVATITIWLTRRSSSALPKNDKFLATI
jgi:hypothetical protein